MKKIIAGTSAVALLAMNVAFAAQIGTGTYSDSGATSPINHDGTSASGSLTVDVSANVQPFLNFNIAQSTINLGDLPLDGSTKTVAGGTITAQTNAAGNIVIMTKGQNGGLLGGATNFLLGGATGDADNETDGFSITTIDNGSTPAVAGTGTFAITTLDQNIVTQSTANQGKDINVNVLYNAEIAVAGANMTPADSYSEVLTYTITGSF